MAAFETVQEVQASISSQWSLIIFLSHAEQLVLYLKSAELLSGALHSTMDRVKQGKLYPSATVKQGEIPFCCGWSIFLKCLTLTRTHLLLCSGEKAERAVQVQRGVLPFAQHSSGAFLLQEASSDRSDLLHHS